MTGWFILIIYMKTLEHEHEHPRKEDSLTRCAYSSVADNHSNFIILWSALPAKILHYSFGTALGTATFRFFV